jgi:hypothetical protein
MIRATRVLLGAVGVGLAGYGVKLFLDIGGENTRAAASWLIGGVVLHDAVLAPATVVVWFAASRLLGGRLPAPVVVGAVVLFSATLVAWPVLGRHHARPDNLTLLDRNYALGWVVVAGLTAAGVVIGILRERRRVGR